MRKHKELQQQLWEMQDWLLERVPEA